VSETKVMKYYRGEPCEVLGKPDRFGRVPVWLTGANKYALPRQSSLTNERKSHDATQDQPQDQDDAEAS